MASFSLDEHGIHVETILRNPSSPVLYEMALKYEEGSAITRSGALVALSGAKTGRSPLDAIRLVGHLNRMARFNTRADKPTAWKLEVHTGPDYLERFKRERAGNVVVISGRNRGKINVPHS